MKNIIQLQKKLTNSDDGLAINLAKAMREYNISEAELARQTQIPQPTLHKILSGRTEDPRFSTLQQLASFFNLTVDELVSGCESKRSIANVSVHAIPVLSWRDCLKGLEFIGGLTTKDWKRWVSIENAPSSSFGIETTPCFEPRFPRGTILIVDPNIIPKDGDLAVVWYPNTDEATLRELSIDGPSKYLFAVNAGGVRDVFFNEVQILGVVIEYRFFFN